MIDVRSCGIALVDLKQYYFMNYRVIERGKKAGCLEIERMTRRKDALKRGQQKLIVPPEGILRWPREEKN